MSGKEIYKIMQSYILKHTFLGTLIKITKAAEAESRGQRPKGNDNFTHRGLNVLSKSLNLKHTHSVDVQSPWLSLISVTVTRR